MPNQIRDLREVTIDEEKSLIFEKNVSIALKASPLPVRCNVYRCIDSDHGNRYPVLVTYGPYGKDIPYGEYVYDHSRCSGWFAPWFGIDY